MRLLDTNVAIHVRDGDPAVTSRVARLGEDVVISVLTRIELEARGIVDVEQAALHRARLRAFLAGFPVLPFDSEAADGYRAIIEAVGFSRRKIIDRMIAAQAIAHGATLVTLNMADFADIPGLRLESW